MTKKIYLEPLTSALGDSILHYLFIKATERRELVLIGPQKSLTS